MDFLEIFTSVRYHGDMKILKILDTNSNRFTNYGIFKKWQVDEDSGIAKYNIFLDNFYLKNSGLKDFPGYVFWLKKLKNDIKTALKPTGIKL